MLKVKKVHKRLPKFVPQWIQRKVEVNVYELYKFINKAASSLTSEDWFLDAGAGEGRFKPEFSHTKYVGVDLAIGDADWDFTDLDVISNLERLPFGENFFNAALCTQVLEHVAEPYQVLSEITRVLKPGGRLFLAAPQSWHQHQKPHDYYRYTSYGFKYLIEKAGLELVDMQPLGGYFWFLSFQLQNINYWLFPKGMRFRWLTWPFRAINGVIFQIILPLILFYLDPLDKIKDETFGHACVAIKPSQ